MVSPVRVLLVEDDGKLARALLRGLREEGLQVDHAAHGEDADLFLADRTYDVVVLDRLLPGTPGDALLERWRRRGLRTPILMLTALDAVPDRVAGLRAGADDYLGKPFAFAELVARILALGRRGTGGAGPGPAAGALELDPSTRTLRRGDRRVPLTAREYALMDLFLRHPGQVLPRGRLAEAAWTEPWEAADNTIEAHIKNLRKKLADLGAADALRTHRGAGYALEV